MKFSKYFFLVLVLLCFNQVIVQAFGSSLNDSDFTFKGLTSRSKVSDVIYILGQPNKIEGPENSFQTLTYPFGQIISNKGLGFNIKKAGYPTARGVQVGDSLDDLVSKYPNLKINSDDWRSPNCTITQIGYGPNKGSTNLRYSDGTGNHIEFIINPITKRIAEYLIFNAQG